MEETGLYKPLLIFAEGFTTNGTGLNKFRKGAFSAGRSIQPIVLKYDTTSQISTAFDIIELIPLTTFNLSWSCQKCTILKLPMIQPTDYLYETHAN